jgi:hypothetical protein
MNQTRYAQPVATVLLIVLFFVPAFMRRLNHAAAAPVTGGGSTVMSALKLYGFSLEEASAKSGISFTHQAPHLDPKLSNIMEEVAAMGAAVSIVDFDKDGWDDIYVTNSGEGTKNSLYHNNHDGTFTDVASQMGVADLNQPGAGVCMGAVWGDYDNDGYEDLLVYKWGKPELFHNDKGKGFTRVTDQAGLPAWINANSAIWVDYDNDGKLDLLICGYYPDGVDLWHLKNTRMMPDSFEFAGNGGRKYLLHNLGNGKFEDVTARMGIDSHRWTLGAVASDLRGTGYPDIILANDYAEPEFYANLNGKGFKEISRQAGMADKPKSGMNASVGDILNQGTQAVYISNISEAPNLMQGNNLWVPRAGTSGDNVKFDNMAHDMGVELGNWSFGAQFGDLNNDGNLDLFLTDGFISQSKTDTYWYDYSKVSGGNSSIIGDAANWPPVNGRSHAGYENKHVWVNDGEGKFLDVAAAVGVTDLHDGRAVALADFRNNGMLDVVVANQKGPLLLYRNQVAPGNHWIEFSLEGTKSNRSAIGAEVTVNWAGGRKQIQEIHGGSGFCAENSRRLHFGLGKTAAVDKVVVRWPSGSVQTLPAPVVDSINSVKEPG